jgi:hypothetical protein
MSTPRCSPDRDIERCDESQAEEREIVSVLLEEAIAQAASREHAVAVSIAGEMDDESLIGILRAVSDGNDTMRHVIPEHRHDFAGPALVCAKIGCVVENEAHATGLLASIEWNCFTTFPRFVTLPAEHAIEVLVSMDFRSRAPRARWGRSRSVPRLRRRD